MEPVSFEDVPESARVMYDKDGEVWVKMGGAWKYAADHRDPPSPAEPGASDSEMRKWEPYRVVEIDPPTPTRPVGDFGVTITGPNGTKFSVANSTMETVIPAWPGASLRMWGGASMPTGVQEYPLRGGPIQLGPGLYRVKIVDGLAEFQEIANG